MGYADGNGYIEFKTKLTNEQLDDVYTILREAFYECDPFQTLPNTRVYIYDADAYHEDVVLNVLHQMEPFGIEKGEMEYVDEDYVIWRFIWKGGKWQKEYGHIEYSSSTVSRLIKALNAYVEHDLVLTEIAYVKDVLMNVCGLNKNELDAFGFGWMFDEEEK